MAVLGLFIARLGWRRIMAVGIVAHALRFFIYAIGEPTWLVIGSNVVHGMCYAFFFGAVYIFVDEYFPKDARASAQGLFNLLILGLGPFLGNLLWGYLGDRMRAGEAVDFQRLFLWPAGLGVVAVLVLLVGFHPKKDPGQTELAKAA
jgi:MFS family permease